MEVSALLIVDVVVSVSNSSHINNAISSRYNPGFSSRWSQSASNVTGVMLRRRPTRFGGALTLPNSRRLERIFLTDRSLQPAASAIWDAVSGSPLINISRMRMSCDTANLGAMIPMYYLCDVWNVDMMYLRTTME